MTELVYSLTKIRDSIAQIPEQFEQDMADVVTITQNGKPIMHILPHTPGLLDIIEAISSYLETQEILQDKEMMASMRQGIKDMEEGNVILFEEVMKELGWE